MADEQPLRLSADIQCTVRCRLPERVPPCSQEFSPQEDVPRRLCAIATWKPPSNGSLTRLALNFRLSAAMHMSACSYAELSFGETIIMLGAVSGFEIDKLMRQPDEIGGAETQSCYYFVRDVEAHYARACAEGAEIVLALKTQVDGQKGYTCRDPEGHLWTFGTYDPWHGRRVNALAAVEGNNFRPSAFGRDGHGSFPVMRLLSVGLLIPAAIFGFGVGWFGSGSVPVPREPLAARAALLGSEPAVRDQQPRPHTQTALVEARRLLSFEFSARQAAERASLAARADAASERRLRISAQRAANGLAEQLSSEQRAEALAQSSVSAMRRRLAARAILASKTEMALAAMRAAKDQAERAATEAQRHLLESTAANAVAEQAMKGERERLTFISDNARRDAEQAVAELRQQTLKEQAARVAAEQETKTAQEELARERKSKQEAWNVVAQLKKRLAMAQGNPVKAKATPTKAPQATKSVAARPKVDKQKTASTAGEWDISAGPPFQP